MIVVAHLALPDSGLEGPFRRGRLGEEVRCEAGVVPDVEETVARNAGIFEGPPEEIADVLAGGLEVGANDGKAHEVLLPVRCWAAARRAPSRAAPLPPSRLASRGEPKQPRWRGRHGGAGGSTGPAERTRSDSSPTEDSQWARYRPPVVRCVACEEERGGPPCPRAAHGTGEGERTCKKGGEGLSSRTHDVRRGPATSRPGEGDGGPPSSELEEPGRLGE